jgi:hypothetical protein
MADVKQLSIQELEASLDGIRRAPRDQGELRLIVRRPEIGGREVVEEAELDLMDGLVGDNWKTRGSTATPDGSAHPDMQLNIMNFRVIDLVAQDRRRWPLAGDQLYLDMDLSTDNLPVRTRVMLGSAIIEITSVPHNGCKKFTARFGIDAVRFVNSPLGKQLRLRGLNAKVVQSGVIRVGDRAKKVAGGQ